MIAAVLAKRSGRFPGKHMCRIDGGTLIGTVVSALLAAGTFDDVVVFTKDPDVKAEGARILRDTASGTALDSIASLLESFGEVFVAAGDMPLISRDFIREMLSMYRGYPLFPVHSDGRIEPLHGIYNSTMAAALGEYRESGCKSLKGLIRSCRHDTVLIGAVYENSFFNINYKEDLESLKILKK